MIIKDIKEFVLRIVAGANVVTVLLMLAAGYSDRLDPVSHPLLANAGLVFPVFLVLNLAFLVFWVMVRLRWVIIPVAGLILGFQPVRTYAPLNVSVSAPDSCIKVISYNVYNLSSWLTADEPCEISEWLLNEDADIVCLQEIGGLGEAKYRRFMDLMSKGYAYKDTAAYFGHDEMAIFSKFPIVGKERIPYVSDTNFSAAFRLLVGKDTVTVVSNHLESIAFTPEEKTQFKTIVKGDMEHHEAETTSRHLAYKLSAASRRRAPQADAVADYVRSLGQRNTILCGDFNDSPISYTHRTIAGELTDCYVSTANGPGISYHLNGFYVRIDNIFCSSDWTPYDCRVVSSIKASDHYPIICWLKKNQ